MNKEEKKPVYVAEKIDWYEMLQRPDLLADKRNYMDSEGYNLISNYETENKRFTIFLFKLREEQ